MLRYAIPDPETDGLAPAVKRHLACTSLPDGYRTQTERHLKFFLGLGQKKCCRWTTTRIGQKESKLGHDSPLNICRIAEIYI